MKFKAKKLLFINKAMLPILGVLIVFLLAVVLLWHGKKNNMQSIPALVAQVYFDGEYRVGNGPWQKISETEHIPATEGDVILRGNFHMKTPYGEYIGIYTGDVPIAFYMDHIQLTIYEDKTHPYVMDVENPLFGDSSCCECWLAYTLTSGTEAPIEIHIHNPHRFGNETAIDAMLSGIALWSGIEFEKGILDSGATQREIGVLFAIVSVLLLGTALFSTLIHIKNARIMWILGLVILFAGTYLSFSAKGVSFWNESTVTNTAVLVCSLMFYMLLLCMAIVHLLKNTKRLGTMIVFAIGVVDAIFLALPMLTDVLFYDTLLYWILAQGFANGVLIGCLIKEFCEAPHKQRWLYLGLLLPLVAFCMDVVMTSLGIWKGAMASLCVFSVFFVVAMVAVLKIIPQSINALTKAKELETEKMTLNAQLKESRVSTMMSQIRPHFIYNTLGSIEQLCEIDPQKAGALVHNFAKYLRGNFGELDNPRPIPISQEMEHVRYYISIEQVRFPDMTFLFKMDSIDFCLPALTIQPIVENAVKHGLMKREKGGTIRVVSYETDTHYCVLVEDDGAGFDAAVMLHDRSHMGIRNIRERLQTMVNGTIEIESTLGIGTKVRINIPKEVGQ